MHRIGRSHLLGLAVLIGSGCSLNTCVAMAESGVLVVHVKDVQRHPIGGLQIGVEGDGGSAITGDDGKARIQLAKQTKEKSWVSLQILRSPPNKDYVMVSPWEYRAIIPSFENESENFIEVVVVQRGDRAALESGTVLAAATAQINKANATKTVDRTAPEEDPRSNLIAVAKQYGVSPDDLDRAIRAWGAKATDPYDAGLVSLYERRYANASSQLAEALKIREQSLAADQKAAADAAFFLGRSLYEEGLYRDSAASLRRCLQLRPDDSTALNDLGINLTFAGEYGEAEPILKQALAIREKTFGLDAPQVATTLNNLAILLKEKGDYSGAERLFQRALAIDIKAHGKYHPHVATDIDNLGMVFQLRGEYTAAEPLYSQALEIRRSVLGPSHPDVATSLDRIGSLLEAEGTYLQAESLLRQALEIRKRSLGPDHPRVAISLNNLASLLLTKKQYADAEGLIRTALAINEKALGSEHPEVATNLNNLGSALQGEHDYEGAEQQFRRALAIDNKALGPDHPNVAATLSNLAVLLALKGEQEQVKPLLQRALEIDKKSLGPNHPSVALDLANFARVQFWEGDFRGAEASMRKALAIDEQALGANHPQTQQIRQDLEALIKKTTVPKPER
jgi:tetratricopeptide (TPR) repeat protein